MGPHLSSTQITARYKESHATLFCTNVILIFRVSEYHKGFELEGTWGLLPAVLRDHAVLGFEPRAPVGKVGASALHQSLQPPPPPKICLMSFLIS